MTLQHRNCFGSTSSMALTAHCDSQETNSRVGTQFGEKEESPQNPAASGGGGRFGHCGCSEAAKIKEIKCEYIY